MEVSSISGAMSAVSAVPAPAAWSVGRVLSVPFQLIPIPPPLRGGGMEWMELNGPHIPARCMIGRAVRSFLSRGGARFNSPFRRNGTHDDTRAGDYTVSPSMEGRVWLED